MSLGLSLTRIKANRYWTLVENEVNRDYIYVEKIGKIDGFVFCGRMFNRGG